MAIRNYAPLRRLVESRMYETGSLVRDSQGTDDDTLDQTTGALTPPGGDQTTVYTGKAVIYPYSQRSGRVTYEGGRALTEKTYTLRIPWDAPEPEIGDVWTTSTSANDSSLVGRPLRVLEVDRSSFLTSRDMVVEDRATP